MRAAEELKRRILEANAQGVHFPSNVVDLMNKFLSGQIISAEEFQIMSNHLPDDVNHLVLEGSQEGTKVN